MSDKKGMLADALSWARGNWVKCVGEDEDTGDLFLIVFGRKRGALEYSRVAIAEFLGVEVM